MNPAIIKINRKPTWMRWLFGALLVVGIAGATAILKRGNETHPADNTAPQAPLVKKNEPGVSPPTVKVETVVVPPTTTVAPITKAAEFDALIKTGKASDAFAAFKLLHSCRLEPPTCGDLTAGQRTQAYRLLNQAVAAQVPKAAVYLYVTTPDGRSPNEFQSDPGYNEWDAHARREIAKAADAGDNLALSQMIDFAVMDKTPDKALMYWTAWLDNASPSQSKQFKDQITEQYSQGLSAERIVAAIAEGHAYAKRTRK